MSIDDALDLIIHTYELQGCNCELNHGCKDLSDHSAIDFLTVPMSSTPNKVEGKLSIPICQECIDGLDSNEWTLLYCIDCCSNQWINRGLSKLEYRHKIIWLKGCPKCTNKLKAIYFCDEKEI